MPSGDTVVRSGRMFIKVAKALSVVGLVAVALVVIAHFAWKYSGSNKWELVIDQNGIKVYSMKTPGSVLKHFRGVTRVKATLDSAVVAMLAHDVKHCAEWFPTCSMGQTIEPFNPTDLSDVSFYRLDLPRPFMPREFLLASQVSQDLNSGAALVTFTAVPDRLPRNACCFRMAEMHNSWKFTPLGNGEIEVEFTEHMDQGLPYVLVNQNMARGVYRTLKFLPRYLGQQEWQNAKVDFIKEN
jgi:hypothetical protein